MTRQQIREALWFYVNEPVISLPCRVKFSEEDPQLEIKRARIRKWMRTPKRARPGS